VAASSVRVYYFVGNNLRSVFAEEVSTNTPGITYY